MKITLEIDKETEEKVKNIQEYYESCGVKKTLAQICEKAFLYGLHDMRNNYLNENSRNNLNENS